MKLLLAEDEKELSRAVTAILEHAKYAVDAAYDGAEALALAENSAYDVMVFDIMMPIIDGIRRISVSASQSRCRIEYNTKAAEQNAAAFLYANKDKNRQSGGDCLFPVICIIADQSFKVIGRVE